MYKFRISQNYKIINLSLSFDRGSRQKKTQSTSSRVRSRIKTRTNFSEQCLTNIFGVQNQDLKFLLIIPVSQSHWISIYVEYYCKYWCLYPGKSPKINWWNYLRIRLMSYFLVWKILRTETPFYLDLCQLIMYYCSLPHWHYFIMHILDTTECNPPFSYLEFVKLLKGLSYHKHLLVRDLEFMVLQTYPFIVSPCRSCWKEKEKCVFTLFINLKQLADKKRVAKNPLDIGHFNITVNSK